MATSLLSSSFYVFFCPTPHCQIHAESLKEDVCSHYVLAIKLGTLLKTKNNNKKILKAIASSFLVHLQTFYHFANNNFWRILAEVIGELDAWSF